MWVELNLRGTHDLGGTCFICPLVEGRDYFIRPPVEGASSAFHRYILVFICSLMSCKIIDGLLNGVFIGGPLAIIRRIAC